MSLPLEGIKVIDFTGTQAGPSCTQLLAWFGADVIKIEKVGKGDVTRKQLRDIPNADALYFVMLNSNKRSIEINTKTPEGKEILEKLVQESDIMVENLAPGALDRMGLTWDYIHKLNPRLIFGSVKGFEENSRYANLKLYENIAQCAGGSASTTGFMDGPPLVTGASLGDANTGIHLTIGILAALRMRDKTGVGQKVSCSMQDAVINLCRTKLRDQLRLEKFGYLEEYPQYPHSRFGYEVPRSENASGGDQPGSMLKCKGWDIDPNAYIYLVLEDNNWAQTCEAIGKQEWIGDPAYNTARTRRSHLSKIFAEIEKWLADKTKHEALEILRKFNVACFPVLSMKEIAYDPDVRENGTIIEVNHKVRGKYLTVGSPIKFSGFTPQIKEPPLLGEHTNEILTHLGYSPQEISKLHEKRIVASTALK